MSGIALLAGLLSGLLGAMGLGGGAVLILYLSLCTDVPQLQAQGINLLFFLPIAAAAVTVYAAKRLIQWKMVLKISLSGLAGSAVGLWLADALGGQWTAKLFGVFLIAAGIKEIFVKGVAKERKKVYNNRK